MALQTQKSGFQKLLVGLVFLAVIGTGVYLLTGSRNPSITSKPDWRDKYRDQIPNGDERNAKLVEVIKAEDTVLDLTPRLQAIAKWFCQTCIGANSDSLPDDLKSLTSIRNLSSVKLQDVMRTHDGAGLPFVKTGAWPIAKNFIDKGINPWHAAAGVFDKVTSAKFGVLSGTFASNSFAEFLMETSFSARCQLGDQRFGISSHQTLTWHLEQSQWKLKSWDQKDFHLLSASHSLFEDALDRALPDVKERMLAERSRHDERLVQLIKTGKVNSPDARFTPFYPIESSYCFPSVSVVDYDQDNDDDLFLTARWGPTQFLQNLGDGTFRESGSEIGLTEKYAVNCVVFADFDNDGDQDAIVGFSLLPAKFYINDGGRFQNVTDQDSPFSSIAMVSGIAVSDVNRDGLLDIYISTYRPEENQKNLWIKTFVTKEELPHLQKRLPQSHRFLNNVGPANALLINQGNNKFKRASFEGDWSQWRDSFQATWADFDNDGDDDLYICNDFSPDALLRNDTPVGAADPILVDVTKEVFGSAPQAFGMGSDWGDFDSDGDLDLYVSNMYSKAGKRIIKHLDADVDPRIPASAAGNFLYENREGKLFQIAGSGPGQSRVHKVGWSYGGQFADFDNNGWQDIYVPSGYYTPPKEIATKIDL